MRPWYETAADRRREDTVVRQFLAAYPDLAVVATVPGAPADRAVSRDGRHVAWLEVKCRSCCSWTYPTYILSAAKVRTLAARGPSMILVRWRDCAGHITAADYLTHAVIRMGGRYDRGDPRDIEPMAEVPITLFTRLRPPTPVRSRPW